MRDLLHEEVIIMPWMNLGRFLSDLLHRRIDPEDVGVYVPEPDSEDEDVKLEEEE